MKRVALVCDGNICRSFMAEKVFAHHIAGAEFISAGVTPHGPGVAADRGAADALVRRGYTDTSHVCRGISDRLLTSDYLLAMTDVQARMLVRLGAGRVRLLTSFDPAARYEQVADPWGLPPRVYGCVLALIERCIPEVRATVAG